MVMGGPGAGKSTLARLLGDRTGMPVHHMDHIHYSAGWQPRPQAEKLALHDAVVAQDDWIFEGGLSSGYEKRAARADLLVFLDVPLVQRLYRVFRRARRYRGQTRPDMAPGCIERVDPEFLRWMIDNARRIRRRDLALIARFPDRSRILRTRRQVARFLDEIAP